MLCFLLSRVLLVVVRSSLFTYGNRYIKFAGDRFVPQRSPFKTVRNKLKALARLFGKLVGKGVEFCLVWFDRYYHIRYFEFYLEGCWIFSTAYVDANCFCFRICGCVVYSRNAEKALKLKW